MRRFAFVVMTSLAMLTLAVPGVQARHSSHRPAPSFVAKTNTATQGGTLHIVAKVKHATKGSTFSATATVHFASGDQTVTLKRNGKSFVARGNLPVASDETPGSVPVSVTVTYNGEDNEVETQADVQDDQGVDPTDTPEPAETPDPGD